MRNRLFLRCMIAWLVAEVSPAVCLLDDYSVKAEYDRSTAVVIAKVVSERVIPDGPDPDSLGGTLYGIAVQESIRGRLHGIAEVFSENSTGRFPMLKGKSYLLFLYSENGRLSADSCGNSGLVSRKKQALAIVRELHRAAPEA
jgi:hypothetical protein